MCKSAVLADTRRFQPISFFVRLDDDNCSLTSTNRTQSAAELLDNDNDNDNYQTRGEGES